MGMAVRVLIVHNAYRQRGGEDSVVAAEAALLESHRHSIYRFHADNAGIRGPWGAVRAAIACTYSARTRRELSCVIRDFRPDIVHVHNFFPLLSPSLYDACQDAGVPVVQTLHNYRITCPGALLMRAGRVCEDCVTGSAYGAIRHGCYRGSRLATLPVAHMVETHRARGTWHLKVDRYIALTSFAKSRFVAAGLPASRITVKPNFPVGYPAIVSPVRVNDAPALFVGRLSTEKGIAVLMEAWKGLRVPLQVLGTGPMESALCALRHPKITVLGHCTPNAVSAAMKAAGFVVLPSISYEGFPMTLVESFSHARPVIASRIGSLAELVEDGATGLLAEPGDPEDLAHRVKWASEHPEAMRVMGIRAREEFERKYTPAINYRRLSEIYRETLGA